MTEDASQPVTTDAGSSAQPAALRSQRDRALRRLRTVFLLSWLLPLLGYALVSAYLYRENQAEARMRLDRSVRSAQEHALKMFETNQMLLQRMLDLVGRSTDEEILARAFEGLDTGFHGAVAPWERVSGVSGAEASSASIMAMRPPSSEST